METLCYIPSSIPAHPLLYAIQCCSFRIPLSKVTLPKHPIQILRLLLRKCLYITDPISKFAP